MRIVLPSGTPAELAQPPDGNPSRGVVLFPDIGGLRPLFDDLCARLAADHGLTVNAGVIARGDDSAKRRYCAALDADVRAARIEPGTLYLVHEATARALAAELREAVTCDERDAIWRCAA